MDCPELSQLSAWIRQELKGEVGEQIERHVRDCTACQERVDRLTEEGNLQDYKGIQLPQTAIQSQQVSETLWSKIRDQVVEQVKAIPVDSVQGNDTEAGNNDDTVPTPQRSIPQPNVTPNTIGDYHIERFLSRGAYGEVYLAWDQRTERSVAIKVLQAQQLDATTRERFFREVKLAARVTSPEVTRVLSSGETEYGLPYLVMEYVAGGSMQDRIEDVAESGMATVDFNQLSSWVQDAAKGLAAIHKEGLIHRDIKPANILITETGSKAKISDFGVARKTADTITLTANANLLGTLAYMSPEQSQDATRVAPASDVYSLGATLYHALTGQTPFQGTPQAILAQIRDADPLPPRQLHDAIPSDLETICLKSMEKNAAQRYESAQALADDLERYRQGVPILARPVSRLGKVVRWCGRNKAIAIATATSGLLLLLLGIGSTIAALRLAAANRSIVKAEAAAVQDRTAALDAFTNLVSSLYDELAEDTARIKTRETIINAAVKGLQSITTVKGDRTADRTTMLAHQRLGELYGLRGMSDKAVQELELAIEMAEALANASPDDDSAQKDLSKALDAATIHYMRSANVEQSALYRKRSQAVLQRLSDNNRDDVDVLQGLLTARISELDGAWRTMPPEAVVEKAESYVPDAERIIQLAPNNSRSFRLANGVHSRLGRSYLESGDTSSCLKHFTLAQQHITRAIDLSPENKDLLRDAAVGNRMMGVLLGSLSKNDEAIQSFNSAMAHFKSLADSDPDDIQSKFNVGNTLVLISKPYANQGLYQEALQYLNDAIAVYEAIMEADANTNVRGVLVQANFEKSNIHALEADWEQAYLAAKQTSDLLTPSADLPNLSPGELVMVPIVEALRDSYALVAGTTIQNDVWPPPRLTVALFTIGLDDARRSDSMDLTANAKALVAKLDLTSPPATFDQLYDTMEQQPDQIPMVQALMDTLVARIEALRFTRLNQRGSNLAQAAKINAVKRLEKFANQYPAQVPDTVLNNQNLRPIVESPEFQSLGIVEKP